jgi:hypothetical protein
VRIHGSSTSCCKCHIYAHRRCLRMCICCYTCLPCCCVCRFANPASLNGATSWVFLNSPENIQHVCATNVKNYNMRYLPVRDIAAAAALGAECTVLARAAQIEEATAAAAARQEALAQCSFVARPDTHSAVPRRTANSFNSLASDHLVAARHTCRASPSILQMRWAQRIVCNHVTLIAPVKLHLAIPLQDICKYVTPEMGLLGQVYFTAT